MSISSNILSEIQANLLFLRQLKKKNKIGELSSPSTSPVQTPDHDISPQNRKEYYTHVFMVGSPPRMNSPPRDAPFQSVFNLTQDLTSTSGISTTNHTTQPIEFSQVTTVEQPTTSTSEIRVQKTGPAALGDAITYFPGKYTGNKPFIRQIFFSFFLTRNSLSESCRFFIPVTFFSNRISCRRYPDSHSDIFQN
jgi:hypothetical protein